MSYEINSSLSSNKIGDCKTVFYSYFNCVANLGQIRRHNHAGNSVDLTFGLTVKKRFFGILHLV